MQKQWNSGEWGNLVKEILIQSMECILQGRCESNKQPLVIPPERLMGEISSTTTTETNASTTYANSYYQFHVCINEEFDVRNKVKDWNSVILVSLGGLPKTPLQTPGEVATPTPYGGNVQSSYICLSLDIFFKGKQSTTAPVQIPIERWVFTIYRDENPTKMSTKPYLQVFNNACVLLRSIVELTRGLPAYSLFKRIHNPFEKKAYNLEYSISISKEVKNHFESGVEIQKTRVLKLSSEYGRLSVHIEYLYRDDIDNAQCRRWNTLNPNTTPMNTKPVEGIHSKLRYPGYSSSRNSNPLKNRASTLKEGHFYGGGGMNMNMNMNMNMKGESLDSEPTAPFAQWGSVQSPGSSSPPTSSSEIFNNMLSPPLVTNINTHPHLSKGLLSRPHIHPFKDFGFKTPTPTHHPSCRSRTTSMNCGDLSEVFKSLESFEEIKTRTRKLSGEDSYCGGSGLSGNRERGSHFTMRIIEEGTGSTCVGAAELGSVSDNEMDTPPSLGGAIPLTHHVPFHNNNNIHPLLMNKEEEDALVRGGFFFPEVDLDSASDLDEDTKVSLFIDKAQHLENIPLSHPPLDNAITEGIEDKFEILMKLKEYCMEFESKREPEEQIRSVNIQ